MRNSDGRWNFANVVSVLALVVALGSGTAIAAKMISSKQIKNNSVKSKDLKDGKGVLGKDVKDGSLNGADVADGGIGGADLGANSVDGAKITDGSVGVADLKADEPFRLVGAAGQPAFGNGGEGDCLWADASGAAPPIQLNPPAFYKDSGGVVHLVGITRASNGPGGDATCNDVEDGIIFTLPAGYIPENVEYLIATPTNAAFIVGREPIVSGPDTLPPGSVYFLSGVADGSQMLFDGFTFRADSPGNGLPMRRGAGAESADLDELRQLIGG